MQKNTYLFSYYKWFFNVRQDRTPQLTGALYGRVVRGDPSASSRPRAVQVLPEVGHRVRRGPVASPRPSETGVKNNSEHFQWRQKRFRARLDPPDHPETLPKPQTPQDPTRHPRPLAHDVAQLIELLSLPDPELYYRKTINIGRWRLI